MQAQTFIGIITTAFVVLIIVPLLLFFAFPALSDKDTVWTNEQYHQLDDGPSPFWGFLKVLGIIAVLGTIALAIVYAMAPDKPETFDPPV